MSANPVTPKTEISFDNTAIAFSGASDVELRKSRWLFRLMGNPALVDIGAHFTKLAFKVGLPVKTLVKKTIYAHFCGGESLQETLPTVNRLSRFGVSTILDYGVEGKESEEEFARAMTEQLNAIKFADEQSTVPYISCKITAYARFELLTALNEGEDLSMQQLRELLSDTAHIAVVARPRSVLRGANGWCVQMLLAFAALATLAAGVPLALAHILRL